MYLRNTWYVAEWGHDVERALHPVKILGEDIVLFRREDGTPQALADSCPHRKLPLSMGRLQGDHVVCGYHGMTFDGAGACVRVPGQERIPPRARVHSYPVEERWGLIWIWMGDPALADPDTIFAVEHYDDPAWGINRGAVMHWPCNYLLITDNLLDPSHVAFVHQTSFGSDDFEEDPVETRATEDAVVTARWLKDHKLAAFYKPLVRFEGLSDRLQHYEVRYPCNAIIKAVITPAGTGGDDGPLHPDVFYMDSYNFITPVDERNSRYFYFQIRNVEPHNEELSNLMNTAVLGAFTEDLIILEAVQKGIDEDPATIDIAVDAGPLRFRRRLQQLIEAEQSALARAG